MSSIFRKDKIGALSEAGGTISLTPSILTIGGRQFETTSSINVALPSLTANTRYQIFAVNNAGTVELVISQNENSQGPAGWSAWKLVGSFYANGLSSVGFGSFVNITGVPRTQEATLFDMVLDSTTSNPPTRGSVESEITWWKRDGKFLIIRHDYRHVGGGGTNGTGSVKYLTPDGFEWDTTYYTGNNWQSPLGICTLFILGNTPGDGTVEINSPNGMIISADTTSSDNRSFQSNSWFAYSNSELRVAFEAKGLCEQFDETPIEDL